MKIAVIYNLSKEGVINVLGRQNREQYNLDEIDAVVAALRAHKHTVKTFEGDKFLIDKLEAFMPRALKGEQPGLVFNLAYGIQGESRYTHVPSLLEMLGIPYLGSGPLAHSIALDKAMTKMVLSRAGLPTPEFQVVTDHDWELAAGMRFPLIVKPKDEAVSFGIKVVADEAELKQAVDSTLEEFAQPALVEEFLNGEELNIGLLGNGHEIEVLPSVEIDFGDAEQRYQTFESKKQDHFGHVCPARISDELTEEARRVALVAFQVVGCRDCARIDFRVDDQGRPSILEINSMPAIHRMGSYFAAAQHVGYDYPGMINKMVQVARARYAVGTADATPTVSAIKAAPRSPEARVTEFVRGASDKMERRLAELVDRNSFTRNKEGADQVARLVHRGLEPLGLSCQVFEQTEIGDVLLLQNDFEGERADVLLLCHSDVFSTSDEAHRRYSKSGNRIYGAGVAESKGGLVVLEYALRALRHLRLLPQLRVRVLLTSDHALGNRFSAPMVRREMARAGCVLSFKPGGPEGQVVTRRHGVGLFSAMVESAEPTVTTDYLRAGGANAIGVLAHKVWQWNKLSDAAGEAVVCVTSLRAEARSAMRPQSAHATLFVSFAAASQGEQLTTQIKKIARRNGGPGTRCVLKGRIEHEPFDETPQVLEVYQQLSEIAGSMGVPLGQSTRYTASEINLVRSGDRAIDGLGPVSHNTRTDEESIEAHTLVERAVLVALFLRGLVKK